MRHDVVAIAGQVVVGIWESAEAAACGLGLTVAEVAEVARLVAAG